MVENDWRICRVTRLNAPDEAGVAEEDRSSDPLPEQNPAGQSDAGGSLFFQRLERPIAGEFLCLQMQGHYLAVHSTDGQQLILCRMEDAARELGSLGQRVHRSWWVAHDAIDQFKRRNGRMSLRLKDGREVPVGRTYQQVVAAAESPSRTG